MYTSQNINFEFCIPWDDNKIIQRPGDYFSRLSEKSVGKRKIQFVTYLNTMFLQSILTVVNGFIENYVKKEPELCPTYTNFLEYVEIREKCKKLIGDTKKAVDVLRTLAIAILFSKSTKFRIRVKPKDLFMDANVLNKLTLPYNSTLMSNMNQSSVNKIIFGYERSLFIAESAKTQDPQICTIDDNSVTWIGSTPQKNPLCSCEHKILTSCPMSKAIYHRMEHIFSEICVDREEYDFAKTIKISIPFLIFTHVNHYVLANFTIYKLKNRNYTAKITLINHMGLKFEDKLKKITIHLIQFMAWAQKEQIKNFSNQFQNDQINSSKDIAQNQVKISFEYVYNPTLPTAFVQNDDYSCGHICLFNVLRTFAPNTTTETVEKMSRSELLVYLLHDYCLNTIEKLTNESIKKPILKSKKKNKIKRLQYRSLK